jgi:hypothetical protein
MTDKHNAAGKKVFSKEGLNNGTSLPIASGWAVFMS